MVDPVRHTFRVALALTWAGATFFVGCAEKQPPATIADPETTPTQISYNHRIINSENGRRQYRMETPLLERYELAAEPFMEFRQGIKVETFDDSLRVDSDIRADYAHYNETKKLWTARGNVVAHNYAGNRILYTERLYWDERSGRIYSDTVARVFDGNSLHVGRNFEADQSFEEWTFHNTGGQIEVDATPSDTTASTPSGGPDSSPSSSPIPAATPRPVSPKTSSETSPETPPRTSPGASNVPPRMQKETLLLE